MKSKPIVSIFYSKYSSQLKIIFDFYAMLEDPEINEEIMRTNFIIQYKGLMRFCEHFKIMPDILSEESIRLIFETIVKNKPGYGKGDIKGLRYNEFLESIVKISILGKYKLKNEQEPKKIDTKFDFTGIDAGHIEQLLNQIGLTQGENSEALNKKFKKIKLQIKKSVKHKVGDPKFDKKTNERLKLKEELRYEIEEKNKLKIMHDSSVVEVKNDKEKNLFNVLYKCTI